MWTLARSPSSWGAGRLPSADGRSWMGELPRSRRAPPTGLVSPGRGGRLGGASPAAPGALPRPHGKPGADGNQAAGHHQRRTRLRTLLDASGRHEGAPCPRLMVTRGRLRGLGAVVVKGEEGTLHISGRRGPHQRATGGPRGGELPSAVPGPTLPHPPALPGGAQQLASQRQGSAGSD